MNKKSIKLATTDTKSIRPSPFYTRTKQRMYYLVPRNESLVASFWVPQL